MSGQVKDIRAKVYINNKQAGKSMRELESEARKVRNQLKQMPRDSAEFAKAKKHFQQVNGEIRKTRKELYAVNKGWSGLANGFNKYFTLVTAGLTAITGLVLTLRETITRAAELSDLRADVQKTTGLTVDELDRLQKKFDQMNTRTPRAELLKIAAQAGKMGERGVENIADFVEQSNKIMVALGEDLGEDAILKIGKMSDIFNEEMENIGSGINAVSDSTKANAGFLTEWLSRLAGISKELKIKAGDVLGYGATLDELGLKVEMSSTALNGFLADFTKNTDEFGQVAGFAEGELRKLIGEEGVNAGFIAFLEKMRESTNSSEEFLQKLEAVGVTGDRGSQVFLALSQNLDQVRERQALANAEIASGTSLQNEYNRKNENFAANLEKIRRALMAKFMSSDLLKALERFAAWGAEIVRTPVSEKLEEERIELRVLETQLYNTNLKQADRVKLIDDLKSRYPEYLGNLDSEKSTNEEISTAISKVNDQLIKRIVLQSQEERLMEAARDQAGAEERRAAALVDIQTRMAKIMGEAYDPSRFKDFETSLEYAKEALAEMGGSGSAGVGASGISNVSNQVAFLDAAIAEAANANQELTRTTKEYNQVAKIKEAIVKQLGISLEEMNDAESGGSETEGTGDSGVLGSEDGDDDKTAEEKAKEAKEALIAFGESLEAEAASQRQLMENSLQQLWDYERAALLEQDDFKKLTKEEQQQALWELELEHLERVLEGRKQLGMDTMAIEDQIRAHKEEQTEAMRKAEKKHQESMAESMAMSAFNAASQARDAQTAKNAVLNSIRSEIQAYLAKAIAGAIAKEFATKGLLGAVTGGLAAGAAGVLFNSLVPRFNTGGFTGSGFLNDPQVPGRKIAGVTHEDEYVVASEELARPDVQQMVGQIESLRQARFGGGGAAVSSAGTHKVINNTTTQKIEVEALSQVVLQLTGVLKALQEKGIPAIADDRFRRDLEIMQAKEDFINRKSAIRK